MSERKITSNTFNKGLQLDVHPINTPNDVMTSCLNGTIITFNGNEFMLQTDMGNGRVETAYLPAGYIPVGMVEFGGIIYVTSYNPLNNRGQIGSFPSPERNISTDELVKNVVMLSNSDFNFSSNNGAKTFYVQKDLYKDKLSPGDKYLVYSDKGNISNNYNKLCDFDANESNAYFSNGYYKTKPVKLSFATITDEGKIVKLTNNRLFDILTGGGTKKYIIPEMDYKSDGTPNIDSYRDVVTSPYNIFNSKVSGKLILIAELITIDDFSVSIICQASDDKNGVKDISIIASMEYTSNKNVFLNGVKSKCIDSKNPGNEISGSDLWKATIEEDNDIINENRYREALLHTVIGYDYVNREKRSITYTLTPCMTYGEISYLKKTGIIQLDKIGTGLIELYEWRYYIDNSNIMLNWALQAYPEEGYGIFGVRMVMSCYNEDESIDTIVYNVSNKKSYSGSFTETIPLDTPYFKINDNKVLKRNRLYYVTIEIMYKKSTNKDTYINPEEDTERYVYFHRWMYTCPIFNEIYIEGTIYDFINEYPLLGFDSSMDNVSLVKDSDDKLVPYKGMLSSREEITEVDTMSMNQYESNLKVSGIIESSIKNGYGLLYIDKSSVKMKVSIDNKEGVGLNILSNVIKSTKGEVTYTAEQNLEIKKRESYEGEFIPKITKENVLDKEIHNNDVKMEDAYDVTSDSSVFDFATQGNPILKTLEYVKAYGSISNRKVSYEKTIRPICIEEVDFAKYGIRWENNKFVPTNIVGFALDDRQAGGGNGEPWIRFCKIGTTGNETNPKTIRIKGDHKHNGENDPRFRILGDEFVNKSKESWGDDNYNKNIIFCTYAIYDDSRRGNISTSISVKFNGDTLRKNYLWEYGYLGPNTDYTALGVSDKRDIAKNQILSDKTYLFTMLKSKVGKKFVPLNMASRPFSNRDSRPYDNVWKSNSTGLKSHWEAVAAMLMQLYKVVDETGSTTLYSIDNGFYNSRVLSEFYTKLKISVISSDDSNVRMFGSDGIEINENIKTELFNSNKNELYNNDVEDDMDVMNNIDFKFENNEFEKTITYQSSRSFDSIASELASASQEDYTAIIEKCDGNIGYTNMSISKNSIYYIDSSTEEITVKKLDGKCKIFSGTFSLVDTRIKFNATDKNLSTEGDFAGNYLTIDDNGDLYFNDEYHSEGELNDNKLIAVANGDFGGDGDEKTSKNRWFRGWSLFGPISKLKSYKK